MRLAYLACVPLLGACAFDAGAAQADSFQDEDPPMGDCPGTGCPGTAGDAGQAGLGDPCDDTGQCASGFCVAPFVDGDPGTLVCQSACIANLDEAQWCSDDEACCDEAATCTSRGYCEVLEGLDDSGTGTDDPGSSGSDSGSGTGSGSGTDSDSGTDSSSGSDSGSDSGTDGSTSSGSGTR